MQVVKIINLYCQSTHTINKFERFSIFPLFCWICMTGGATGKENIGPGPMDARRHAPEYRGASPPSVFWCGAVPAEDFLALAGARGGI